METVALELDREEAARLMRKYREHRAYQTPIDQEIESIYRAIARGGVVIRAFDSIRKGGADHKGLPKLAICRADAKECFVRISGDGSARFMDTAWINGNTAKSRYFDFEAGSFPIPGGRVASGKAMVPLIPVDVRPARGLANYTILFEPIWEPVPPIDPMLLRRIGKGDSWLVVAAWNLSEIERAVMADRIRAR